MGIFDPSPPPPLRAICCARTWALINTGSGRLAAPPDLFDPRQPVLCALLPPDRLPGPPFSSDPGLLAGLAGLGMRSAVDLQVQ